MKLKENGLEWIEVNDNGVGVEEKNFAALSELSMFIYYVAALFKLP